MIRAAFVLALSLLASSVQAQTRVPAGANLQAALDAALPGDVLELDAGATFTGNYTLPVKNGTAPVTVRTRGLTLPNARIDPAANLATLRTPNSAPALRTVGNTAHWRFDGIRFAAGASQSDIVALGDTVTADAAQLPRDLVFDRSIFQADTSAKNGLSLNSAATTIRRSRFTGIKLAGIESHAIICTNGPGPFTIEDNYIEAGSIGVMFGGAKPAVPNLVPSDILFEYNTVTRPLAMRGQTGWGIKNIFELKNARNVVVRGNVFEHNWPDAQSGWTITITVRANSSTAPWTTIQHVLFEHNIVRHASAGFNILGLDNQVPSPGAPAYPSTPMDDVIIRNNLVYDIDRWVWTGPRPENVGNGVFMQVDGAPRNLHVEQNTGMANGNILNLLGPPIPGFVFRREHRAEGPVDQPGDRQSGRQLRRERQRGRGRQPGGVDLPAARCGVPRCGVHRERAGRRHSQPVHPRAGQRVSARDGPDGRLRGPGVRELSAGADELAARPAHWDGGREPGHD